MIVEEGTTSPATTGARGGAGGGRGGVGRIWGGGGLSETRRTKRRAATAKDADGGKEDLMKVGSG